MDEQERLLQAIIENPTDDAVRLVFSDWQEEHGRLAHAELIRVQCEQAHLDRKEAARKKALQAREKELLASPDLRDVLRHGTKYERGFIDEYFTGSDCIESASEGATDLLDEFTLPFDRVLTLGFSIGQGDYPEEGFMQRFGRRWWVSRITFLQFFESSLLPAPARALAASPHLRNLKKLYFNDSGIPAEAIADLILAPAIRGLEEVHLDGWFTRGEKGTKCRADDSHVNAALCRIAASPRVGSLRTLSLECVGVGMEGANALLESPHLNSLTELSLSGAHVLTRQMRNALRGRFGANTRFAEEDG